MQKYSDQKSSRNIMGGGSHCKKKAKLAREQCHHTLRKNTDKNITVLVCECVRVCPCHHHQYKEVNQVPPCPLPLPGAEGHHVFFFWFSGLLFSGWRRINSSVKKSSKGTKRQTEADDDVFAIIFFCVCECVCACVCARALLNLFRINSD